MVYREAWGVFLDSLLVSPQPYLKSDVSPKTTPRPLKAQAS